MATDFDKAVTCAQRPPHDVVDRDRFDCSRSASKRLHQRDWHTHSCALAFLPRDCHELIRILVGKRLQEHRIQQAEEQCIRADPQRQDEDRESSEPGCSGQAAALTTVLIALTSCTVSLAPSLRLSRLSPVEEMKRNAAGSSPQTSRFRSALVVGQIASSVVLCVLAGLIGQSFLKLLPSDPGFESESRTVQYLSLPPSLYLETGDRVRRWEELSRRIETLPGVTSVAVGTNVPFGGDDGFRSVSASENGGSRQAQTQITADLRAISPNFFQLLQIPLVRGRAFTSRDRLDTPGVAIVNQTLARKLAPEGDVLGRSIQVRGWAALPQYQIVGVVADARSSGTSADVWDELYIPHGQSKAYFGFVIIRSPLSTSALDEMLRKEIRAWAPELPEMPWLTATTMDELMRRSLAGPRFNTTLIGVFSGMALLLAAIGVFGLVAYSASLRKREFGIRAALGARRQDLLASSLRTTVLLTAVGTVTGLAVALGLVGLVESQLYGIQPLDVATFLGAGSVMFVVSALAAYFPAVSAAKVDPMVALRHE